MGNRLIRRFSRKRDALIVQSNVTAAEFAALRDLLHPGMKVRNFTSGNIATVRSTCTIPGKPFGHEGSPYLPIRRQRMAGRSKGKVEETYWSLLNVDVL